MHTYGTEFKAANGNRVIMDRNLGATSTYYAAPATADNKSYGYYYQWGRKDPFAPWGGSRAAGMERKPIQLYGEDGVTALNETNGGYNATTECSTLTVSVATAAGSGNSLAYSVKNPKTVIFNASNLLDWYTNSTDSTKQDNTLWGSNASKGIYDPCPKGWRVAQNGTWDDVGDAPYAAIFQYYINGTAQTAPGTPVFVASGRNGRLYSAGNVKAWYPATSFIHGADGRFSYPGMDGYSRSASASGTYLSMSLINI